MSPVRTEAPRDTAALVAIQQQVEGALLRFLSERSTVIEAGVFDLPAKMVFGTLVSSPTFSGMIDAIEARGVPPEELGRRMKVPGFRLGALALGGLTWVHCFGRLQRYLDAGWPQRDEPIAEEERNNAKVLGWYARLMRAYRNDGLLLPLEGGAQATMPILDGPTVERLSAGALERGPVADATAFKRTLGKLGNYLFMIHGEARDGIFNHGPYMLDDGRVLIVKEWTDLQNTYMPWVTKDRRLPVSRVVVPLVLERGSEVRFDMFGTTYCTPEDPFEAVTGYDVLVGDDLQPADEAELFDIAAAATAATRSTYREMIAWDERQKIFHVTAQYYGHFATFMEAAGCSAAEIDGALVRPTLEQGERYIGRALSDTTWPIWAHLESGHRPVFPEVRL